MTVLPAESEKDRVKITLGKKIGVSLKCITKEREQI